MRETHTVKTVSFRRGQTAASITHKIGAGTTTSEFDVALDFCDAANRLSVLSVQMSTDLRSLRSKGESAPRIDYCEACSGYLKTYEGQGSETLLLADWTSLHLDILAHDRRLMRCAESLYQL
jgi:hypothetical protein